MAMAEKEQKNAHKMAVREQGMRIAGLIAGFLLGGAGIGIAYYMVTLDRENVQHVVYSIAIVISTALAGRFISRRNARR